MEATEMSINKEMDKENVVYMYNGTLIGLLKKAILLYVTTWLNPEDVTLHEIRQPQDKCCVVLFI